MMYTIIFFYTLPLITVTSKLKSSGAPNYYFDSKKGILSYPTGSVYLYDQDVVVPFIYHIPDYIDASDRAISKKCNTTLIVSRLINNVIEDIENKLPLFTHIGKRPQMTDNILLKKKLQVHGAKPPHNGEYSRSVLMVQGEEPTITELTRRKRFVIGGAALLTALASLIGLITTSIVTSSVALNKINILNENQKLIFEKVEEQTKAINILSADQEKILVMVKNLTKKVDELIDTFNCDQHTDAEVHNLITSWANTVPNTFFRALNGVIKNDVTIDLLPGEYLRNLISYFPALSDTIYENEPYLIYKTSKALLNKVNIKPLSLEGVISIPRIFYREFGIKYETRSCAWLRGGRYYMLKQDISYISPNNVNQTYTPDGCVEEDNVVLCAKERLVQDSTLCTGIKSNWDITGCRVIDVTNTERPKVLVTPAGIVFCEPQNISLLKADNLGFFHTQMREISEPTLITKDIADTVIADFKHYYLGDGGFVLNVTEMQVTHNNVDLVNDISNPKIDFNITHLDKIDNIDGLQLLTHTTLYVLPITIVILLFLATYYILYKRSREQKMKRRLGYLMSNLLKGQDKEVSPYDPDQLVASP